MSARFAQPHLDKVFTNPLRPKLVAAGLDPHGLGRGAKPETACDAVYEHRHIIIGKLDDLSTIDTNEVVVIRRIKKVRIVDTFITTQVDLPEKTTLDE